jgi:hypothetical protein
MSKNNSGVKRNWIFIILLTISSLSLAGTAAYFSIFGLAKLFYGAGIGIVILASVLEFSKLVAVSYVYRYWTIIAKALRAYYIFGVVFIMLLTSIGIYGFLTSAYQNTANKLEIRDSQIVISENKKTLFVDQLDRINSTIQSNNNRINNLIGVRSQQESRLDSLYNRGQISNARRTEISISGADEQIGFLNQDITDKMKQASSVNDSIAYYDQKMLELKSSDISGEIGPLKYLSDLTGLAMNKVVNILVLLIIFVFDPMAITLLIGVNQLTMMEKGTSALKNERIKFSKIKKLFSRKKEDEPIETNKEDIIEINKEDSNEEEVLNDSPSIEKIIENDPVRKTPIFFGKEDDENIIENIIEDIIEEEKEEEPKKNELLQQDCQDGFKEEKIELDLLKINDRLKVYHNTFGYGIIEKFNHDKSRVFIRFKDGVKELSPEYANLKQVICVKIEDTNMEIVENLKPNEPENINPEPEIELEPEIVPEPENVAEPPSEKKTIFQKIWKGKKII